MIDIDIKEAVSIKRVEEYCSKCNTCYSVCPFDAITLVASGYGRSEPQIDIEKCQVCGMCASACPSSAIQIDYYDFRKIIAYIDDQREILKTDDLLIACRGSSPLSCDILDTLKEKNITKFISLRLPCVARLPAEFYWRAFEIGINKIVAVQCEGDLCRFKRGNEFNKRQGQLLHVIMNQFGFGEDRLTIIESSQKAVYDTDKCVGCDKCEFVCPFDAIEAQPFATPKIDLEACRGCGTCTLVCPHLAIQLNGFEYEFLSNAIQGHKAKIDKLKSKGVSPVILVFCCRWAEFPALDSIEDGFIKENVAIVELPCFDALDTCQVIEALFAGFDGVIAIVCSEEDCRFKEERDAGERNVLALKRTLDNLNIAERFELCINSPRYMGDFDSKIESFIEKISSLPEMKRITSFQEMAKEEISNHV